MSRLCFVLTLNLPPSLPAVVVVSRVVVTFDPSGLIIVSSTMVLVTPPFKVKIKFNTLHVHKFLLIPDYNICGVSSKMKNVKYKTLYLNKTTNFNYIILSVDYHLKNHN